MTASPGVLRPTNKLQKRQRRNTLEEQLAELAAKIADLEAAGGGAVVTNTMFAETFYYLSADYG